MALTCRRCRDFFASQSLFFERILDRASWAQVRILVQVSVFDFSFLVFYDYLGRFAPLFPRIHAAFSPFQPPTSLKRTRQCNFRVDTRSKLAIWRWPLVGCFLF